MLKELGSTDDRRMVRNRSKRNTSSCGDRRSSLARRPLLTLQEVVDAYILEWQPRCWVAFHEGHRTPKAALDLVASWRDEDRKIYSHQTRVPREAKKDAGNAIRNLDVDAIRDFEDLFECVDRAIGSIPGIGDLTVYDVAARLGASLGKLPAKRVYLQSGALKGARALGVDVSQRSLAVAAFPPELHRLAAWEIEDLLCVYKDELRLVRGAAA